MPNRRPQPIWPIYAAALGLAAVALAFAVALAPDASARALLAARYTARAGFLAFAVVYLAGPGARLWPNSAFRVLAKRRRHLGLATALVMMIHLVALAINVGFYRPRPLSSIAVGGLVYALMLAMVLTSSDAAQRKLGRRWQQLHFVGLHALWVGFLTAYLSRVFKPDYFWIGALFMPLVLALLVTRLVAVRWRNLGKSARTA